MSQYDAPLTAHDLALIYLNTRLRRIAARDNLPAAAATERPAATHDRQPAAPALHDLVEGGKVVKIWGR